MNTQYFTEIINQLNRIAPYLTQYQAYVSKVLATENYTCAQLAELGAETAAKLTQSTTDLSAIAATATADASAMQANITTALAALAPLVIAPTNLAELLTWASAMVSTFLGPQTALIAQEAIITAQLVQVTNAVTSSSNAIQTIADELVTAITAAQTKKGCV